MGATPVLPDIAVLFPGFAVRLTFPQFSDSYLAVFSLAALFWDSPALRLTARHGEDCFSQPGFMGLASTGC